MTVPRNPPFGLADLFARLDYTEQGLRRTLGEPPNLGALLDPQLYRQRLAGQGPLATLAALFFAGLTVDAREAADALRPFTLKQLTASGLVAQTGDGVRALVALRPLAGMLFASDLARPGWETPDHVPGASVAADTLARLTVRVPVADGLDLGTGNGVQALLMARHCDRVTATDVSPRALAFAAFNAELNGVENVELVHGSWFEPVARRTFDLVVANPPYVVSPDAAFTYRDGTLERDEVARTVVEGAAAHLRDGGYALVECNWIHASDGDWREPLESWIAGRGCDAVLLRYHSDDPLSYGADWNRPLNATDPYRFVANLDRWVAYYEREAIEAIGWGVVALRRRAGATNFVRALEPTVAPSANAGEHVARLFGARDYLHSLGSERALLGERLALVDGARVDRRIEVAAGRAVEGAARAEIVADVGFAAPVAAAAAPLVAGCDGRRTLGELVAETGVAAAAALEAARRLIGLGFLVPAE
jgi:methylase of polypeptide subunit release factors